MNEFTLPLAEETVRSLRVEDHVALSGTIITARDLAHKYLVSNDIPELTPWLKDAVIYHCGPIVKKVGSKYQIIAAGPTTSMREEPYMADLIRKYRLKGIIGKGGMGAGTLKAAQKYGCAYFQATGGVAAITAQVVREVKAVYMLEEFGVPEAIWVLRVEKFPLLVTMDVCGQSLHHIIKKRSESKRNKLLFG